MSKNEYNEIRQSDIKSIPQWSINFILCQQILTPQETLSCDYLEMIKHITNTLNTLNLEHLSQHLPKNHCFAENALNHTKIFNVVAETFYQLTVICT